MKFRAGMFLILLAAAVPHGAFAQQLSAAAPPLDDTQLLGRRLFNQSCMVCHAKVQITANRYGPALSRETGGGDAEVVGQVIANGTPRMPGFKYFYQPQQIAAIAQYLKTVNPAASTAGGKGNGDDD